MGKIVINALSARLGGGQTYIRNFLSRVGDTHEYLILVGPYNREVFEKTAVGKSNIRFINCGEKQANPFLRLIWEIFRLPRLLRDLRADIYYAAGGGTLTKMPKGTVSATIIRNLRWIVTCLQHGLHLCQKVIMPCALTATTDISP